MISRENLLIAMTGVSIFTMGLLAMIAHFLAAPSKGKGLLWFGLFASPYGLVLILRSAVPSIQGSQPETLLLIFGRSVGLLAALPALLLFQEWCGNQWHLSSRLLIAIYALAVISVSAVMTLHERPLSTPSPGTVLVILFAIVLAFDHIAAGYQPPPIPHRGVIFGGLLVFFISFSYDRIAHWRSGNETATTEPFGFMVLATCFGIAIARQVAADQAERTAMALEMTAARTIQTRILPAAVPSPAGLSIAVRYAPMTAVAGDFYGFLETGFETFGIVLADVMGHGVPAALVASMVKVSVISSVDRNVGPPMVLKDLNTMLYREAPGEYATAVYISIDRETSSGKYSSAGHPPPLLWHRGTQLLEKLDGEGLLLGVRKVGDYVENNFAFQRGDRLLVYSDGLTEAENDACVSFGDLQLPELITTEQRLSTEDFATMLLKEVRTWSQKDGDSFQSDDITFVVIDFV